MANEEIILGIMLITLVMVGVGAILNRFMGVNTDAVRDIQKKLKILRERMRTAQLTGNAQKMLDLQRESMELTKLVMKKQIIPSCIRCLIFIGIYAVLVVVYAEYAEGLLPFPILFFGTGWLGVYFLFSITFSLILYGFKRLYRKLTGKEVKRVKPSILGMASSKAEDSESVIQLTRQINKPIQEPIQERVYVDEQEDSWKNRIKK